MKFSNKQTNKEESTKQVTRRGLLKSIGAGAAAVGALSMTGFAADGNEKVSTTSDAFQEFFQKNYQKMTDQEKKEAVERLERRYKRELGVDVNVEYYPEQENVLFGYALNISRCEGYRECVKACTEVNNQSQDPQIQYIRVIEMEKGTSDLTTGDHYYDHDTVPQDGKSYFPVQCHQCENPPCVHACPVEATWKEKDGIIVVDYNWCIGCRMCISACPYWARRFNWADPKIAKEAINTETHYLSNRPRMRGVTEKCTFCLQRTRKGEMPACQAACPTGARVFGNLLDPNSEIRYVLANKTVYRLKEELNTDPKFWYYSD